MTSNSFLACETLIKKYAPLYMLVGDFKETPERPYCGRPRIPADKISQMKHLRAEGKTIGEVARICNVSWRSVWHYSKPFAAVKPSPFVDVRNHGET